ncbi:MULTISPECIES: DddA-like double-stranded DNA deaminase toxin [Streptomyces]|jgi:RHS repeat-associated protein|uniref:DddA-like double-stranded DNA deaminase toxin n=1 Tax=Streptomyces sp. 900129855 TaxID=3155129 RepID=A0ABV2ZKW2_9ACTN
MALMGCGGLGAGAAAPNEVEHVQAPVHPLRRHPRHPVSWLDNRGFLNAPDNANTGLTQLGARQYDPTLGRFASLDPLFEATDDQQLAGYAYAAGNPITNSDPSGLAVCMPEVGCGGVKSVEEAVTKHKKRYPKKYDSVDEITGKSINGTNGYTYYTDQSTEPVYASNRVPEGVPLAKGWGAPKKKTFLGALFSGDWREAINQLLSPCDPDVSCGVFAGAEGPLGWGEGRGLGSGLSQAASDLASKRRTTGRIFGSDGTVLRSDITSGSGALQERVHEILESSPNIRPLMNAGDKFWSEEHVETQYAAWMRDGGVTDAHVYINQDYICGGPHGCQLAVRAILPRGSTLTVHYPGMSEPRVFKGVARVDP